MSVRPPALLHVVHMLAFPPMPRPFLAIRLAITVAALSFTVVPPAAARGAPLVAGADRTDPYPRQPIDVEHYRFALTLADTTDRIVGEATVRLRLLAAGLPTVSLDLATRRPDGDRGMQVRAVTRDGRALRFSHEGDRLTIVLERPSAGGETAEFVVRYDGIPVAGLEARPTRHGDRAFFSDNWPDKARQWLPIIDHVGDKATMEMAVTAPAHYQVISNGRRIETTDLSGAQRLTVWRESVPISPWLYVLGVARFAVQHVDDYAGIPIETWVTAPDRDAGFFDFAVPTRDVLAFFSEYVGPYAYEKLANVQSHATSGGMEAASAIMYNAASVTGTRTVRWRNVVIHEIAHQWFGNAVTEADWDDVWLSEGFATYFTLLFIEHAYGRDEFAAGLRSARQTVIDFDARTPGGRVVHENLTDLAQVTSPITYQKGGWVLHMLRRRIGDDRFWSGIREYYRRHRNATATTADFRRVMEWASGEHLGAFFTQWLSRAGVPKVHGTWRWDAARRAVLVELAQVQPGDAYALPVEIGLVGTDGNQRVERVALEGRTRRVAFPMDAPPAGVVLDPHVRLLIDGTLVRAP